MTCARCGRSTQIAQLTAGESTNAIDDLVGAAVHSLCPRADLPGRFRFSWVENRGVFVQATRAVPGSPHRQKPHEAATADVDGLTNASFAVSRVLTNASFANVYGVSLKKYRRN